MIDRLHTPPNESLYRIKGTGYAGHLKWVEEEYPGGIPAFLDALDPEVRAYFQHPFLASTLYDLYPLVIAAHACGRAMKMNPRDFVVYRSRYQALYDQSGVYKLLFKMASPGLLVPRIPKAMAQYFNFGKTEVLNAHAKGVMFSFGPLPEELVWWFEALFSGFVNTIVGQSGGKDAVAKLKQTASAGVDLAGRKLSSLTIEISWL